MCFFFHFLMLLLGNVKVHALLSFVTLIVSLSHLLLGGGKLDIHLR